MSKIFLKRGTIFNQTDDNFEVLNVLDKGVYQTLFDERNNEIYLQKIQENFNFNFKLYGIDETLVKHVVDTYYKQPQKRNIGILLNGVKGTGKTVTAKLIANKLELPIIICDREYPGLTKFLASINHDCIFFFDEFEKNFRLTGQDDEDNAGESLLSVMDGVYNSNNCHIYLLTTNELSINDNMFSRPSRIRYIKSFDNVISREVLEEYIDDNLIYKERKEEIIAFIETLSLGTIDIIKSIIDEVNIHNCSINDFKHFFNVDTAIYKYNIITYYYYEGDKGGNEVKTKEEFLTDLLYPKDEDSFYNYGHRYFESETSLKNLKVGDIINGDYVIDEFDIEKKFIKAHYNANRRKVLMCYVENLDTKPQLYKDNKKKNYGYFD